MTGETTIVGEVLHGDKRGRTLGFPTANVALPDNGAVESGVYAGRLDGRPAAISVGVRPTFGDGLTPLAEVFVLDFDGNLYGQVVTIELVRRLRGEMAFANADALVAQVRQDVEEVRRVLG